MEPFPFGNDNIVEELVRSPWGGNSISFDSGNSEHILVRNRGVDSNMGRNMPFLVHRPLYGSRRAPLRWWLTLASVLQKDGYRQMRSDVCAYVKYRSVSRESERLIAESGKIIRGLVAVHVDDIIYVGNESEYSLFLPTINQFRHGDVTILSAKESFVFCGLIISLLHPKSIRIDQYEFASLMTPLGQASIIHNGK